MGFRGPFVFGLAMTGIDLIGRLLVIERQAALQWGFDPMVTSTVATERGEPEPEEPSSGEGADTKVEPPSSVPGGQATPDTSPPKPISLLAVIVKLSRSPRALVANIITLTYG